MQKRATNWDPLDEDLKVQLNLGQIHYELI